MLSVRGKERKTPKPWRGEKELQLWIMIDIVHNRSVWCQWQATRDLCLALRNLRKQYPLAVETIVDTLVPHDGADKGTGYEGVSGGPGRVAGSKVKSRNDSPSPQGTGRAGASAGTSAEGSRTRAPGSRTSKIRPGGVIAGRSASGSKVSL